MAANHEIPSKEFPNTANCTGAHAHCCTKCRTKYKHKKHIVPKKINRDTKNFPNTVTKQHKHNCTKKDCLRNHWKGQLQCNITTSSTVTKLLHWRVHFFIALESSYFLLHWKVRISNGAVLRLTPPTLNFPELKSGDKLYFGRGPDAEN